MPCSSLSVHPGGSISENPGWPDQPGATTCVQSAPGRASGKGDGARVDVGVPALQPTIDRTAAAANASLSRFHTEQMVTAHLPACMHSVKHIPEADGTILQVPAYLSQTRIRETERRREYGSNVRTKGPARKFTPYLALNRYSTPADSRFRLRRRISGNPSTHGAGSGSGDSADYRTANTHHSRGTAFGQGPG